MLVPVFSPFSRVVFGTKSRVSIGWPFLPCLPMANWITVQMLLNKPRNV